MRSLKVLLLSLSLNSAAHSASMPNFGNFLGAFLGGNSGSGATSSIQSLVINAGLIYAKSDPRFAAILTVLGINNASDLQNFLAGDLSGSNFQDVIVHAAFQYAQQNPKYAEWFAKVGVVDEPSLRAFLNGKGAKYEDFIFSLALKYAQNNSQYSEWLKQLGIEDISDISDIMNGGLEGSNLQDLLIGFGQSYLQSNPQYSQYSFILSLLLGDSTLSNLGSNNMFLGAYEGLPISELKIIQKSKKLKVRTKVIRGGA